MATSPSFAATPVIGLGQISAANTNRDGSGTLVDVLTGATNGTRIERITIQATATTTTGMVRLYIQDNQGTPVVKLWKEVTVQAVTPSGTAGAYNAVLSSVALVLPSGYKLRASTHNAETFNVWAEGGNF